MLLVKKAPQPPQNVRSAYPRGYPLPTKRAVPLDCFARPWAVVLALAVLLLLAGTAHGDVGAKQAVSSRYFAELDRARNAAAAKDYLLARQAARLALNGAREECGADSLQTAVVLDDLAGYELRLQQIPSADRYSAEAVAIAGSPRYAGQKKYLSSFLNTRRAVLVLAQRDVEARDILRRMIALHAPLTDPGDPAALARARMLLAESLYGSGELEEAEQVLRSALSVLSALGESANAPKALAQLLLARLKMRSGHPDQGGEVLEQAVRTGVDQSAWTLSERLRFARDSARAYRDLNRLGEALKVAQQALDERIERSVEYVALQADLMLEVASVYALRWQATEARRYVDLALAWMGNDLPKTHPTYVEAYYLTAVVRLQLGDTQGAIDGYSEVLNSIRTTSGETSERYAFVLAERARALTDVGNPVRGIADADRAIELITQRSSTPSKQLALANAIRGLGLARLDNNSEAIAAFEREVAMFDRMGDAASADLPPGLTWLGRLYIRTGQLDRAESVLERAVAIRRRDAATSPAGVVQPLVQLATVQLKQDKRRAAKAALEESMKVVSSRLVLSETAGGGDLLGEHTAQRETLEHMLDLALWLQKDADASAVDGQTFRIAQLPHFTQTSQATSRALSSARVQDSRLQALIDRRRELQDRLKQARDALRPSTLSETTAPPPRPGTGGSRGGEAERALDELAKVDEQLRRGFPRFADMLYPEPVSIADVQAQLRKGEAFYLQVVFDDSSVHFLVKTDSVYVKRSLLNRQQAREHVARIRKSVEERPPRLNEYPTKAAYQLYSESIGLFEPELLDVRDLVVVLDDAMQTVPVAALLTAAADSEMEPAQGWGALAFLAKRFSTVVAASASSFVTQRRVGHDSVRSGPRKAYLGVGDPAFSVAAPASNALTTRAPLFSDLTSIFKRLPRLPITRKEITLISERFGTDDSRVLVGEAATESAVRAATRADSYRVVSFATHGLLPGQAGAGSEALLALTPEFGGGTDQDGLLTASEIAQMNLGADWILLSACNTAGADSSSRLQVEGYSGLARAFFLAGAQSLLVSHWAVESNATYKLMVETVAKATAESGESRSHALSGTMGEMLSGAMGPQYDHPLFWAPFVLIGAGE